MAEGDEGGVLGGVRWLCAREKGGRSERRVHPQIKEDAGEEKRGEWGRADCRVEWSGLRRERTGKVRKGPGNESHTVNVEDRWNLKEPGEGRPGIGRTQVEIRRAFKRRSSAEHGFMPALTHWVNLLLPGGDP